MSVATGAAEQPGAIPADPDPRALQYAPLTLRLPRPESFTLKNGLSVFLLRDPELPLIDVAFYLPGGAIYDPKGREGLASLATHLMLTGGTQALTPDQVDETIESMPITISVDAGRDAIFGSLSCLKAKFPEGLRLLSDVLRRPRFDPARLEVEKARVVEDIRRRWDSPGSIAGHTFRQLAYGPASAWARMTTVESIQGIGKEDLAAFHAAHLKPGRMLLAVSGDFEPQEMKRRIREVFNGWPAGAAALPRLPPIKDEVAAGVHLVERPLTQSSIVLGHLGATRFDPDKFPLFVLNTILGEGGFTSRLMKEVRSTRGLAYSVSGGVGSDSDRGLFEINCRTRADATVQAIEAIRDVVRRLRDEGPTDEEMRRAIDSRLNSFVFTVDGTAAYMQAYLFYRHYGYPEDYLATWRDRLARVTREDVVRAGKRFLDPDRLAVLVVGNPAGFDRPLDTLGLGAPKTIRLGDEGGPPLLEAAAAGSVAPQRPPDSPSH